MDSNSIARRARIAALVIGVVGVTVIGASFSPAPAGGPTPGGAGAVTAAYRTAVAAAPPAAVADLQRTLVGLPGAGEVTSSTASWQDGYLAVQVRLPPVLLRHPVPSGNPGERTAAAYRAALDASGVPYTLSVRVADHPPFVEVDHR